MKPLRSQPIKVDLKGLRSVAQQKRGTLVLEKNDLIHTEAHVFSHVTVKIFEIFKARELDRINSTQNDHTIKLSIPQTPITVYPTNRQTREQL